MKTNLAGTAAKVRNEFGGTIILVAGMAFHTVELLHYDSTSKVAVSHGAYLISLEMIFSFFFHTRCFFDAYVCVVVVHLRAMHSEPTNSCSSMDSIEPIHILMNGSSFVIL